MTGNSQEENTMSLMDITLDKLRRIKGKVFHMLDENNQVIQCTFGKGGELSLRNIQTISLDTLMEAGKDLKGKIREVRRDTQGRAHKKLRKVVTGDSEKSLREHMNEVPQVKMIDKISFTFGVLCICGSEWLALRQPDLFPVYYYIIMSTLLLWRFITYSKDKYQLFMLDFCYFVNLSVVLQTAFFPANISWFKANYILCMGPLMFAIIVWKNSLVFHSLDKLTSFFLHAFPPLTVHLLRWGLTQNSAIHPDDHITFMEFLTLPMGLYLCWQLSYCFIIEVPLRSQLASDRDLITSLRYLANDKKNGFRNLCISVLCQLGLSQPGEEFDADSVKAKFSFSIFQFVYTAITIIPTPFLYSSYPCSCIYLMFLFSFGTWNGASYYIEVFAERYLLKFENKSVRETTKTENNVADDLEEFESDAENVEIDQSSELYKTIVAAIIEDNKTSENSDVMDWTMDDLEKNQFINIENLNSHSEGKE